MQTFLLASVISLWVVVIFNLVLTLALIRQWRKSGTNIDDASLISLQNGQPAPDFTAETLEGQGVTLSDFKGKNVLFLFVKPTCSACRETLPLYNSFEKEGRHVGIDLILINIGSKEQTFELKEQYSLNLPILYTPEGNSLEKDYQIKAVPCFCFVGIDGVVRRTGYSPELAKQLKTLI